MSTILAHRTTKAPNTTVDVRALRGRIVHLGYALAAALKKILPGQALSDALVGKLAEYCAGAAHLEVHDPDGHNAARKSVARLNAAVLAALVTEATAESAA